VPVEITFGGKSCYAEGANYFNLEVGVTPSMGVVTLSQEDLDALKLESTEHTLTIKDGAGGVVSIGGLRVVRSEVLSGIGLDQAGQDKKTILSVHVADPRYLWQFTDITGQYNTLSDDGIAYIANTVNGTTPHTFDQLLQKCFDALSLNLSAVTGESYIPPNVSWEFIPVSVAMGKLLQDAGYTIAWNPEQGTYSVIDLSDSSASYKPSGTLLSHTKQRRDRGAERPETARVAFRIMRQKQFNMEAVMEHDGKDKGGSAVSTAAPGEYQPVATVLSDWGIDTARVNQGFYAWFVTNQDQSIIDDLGGGNLGHGRLQAIRDQYYRVFRINATDRDSVVPLLPINPEVGKATGRTMWTDARPGDNITYHAAYRVPGGGRLREFSGIPAAYDVKMVNPRDGVVAFVTPNNTPVTGVLRTRNTGHISQDYILQPGTVTCVVGYMKKFSSASDPTADYHLVSQTLKSPTNGKTKTFLAPHTFLRQLDVSGTFTEQNQTQIETEANNFLTRYAAIFDQPDPEEYLVAGIDSKKLLSGGVTAIRWNATDGVTTLLRLHDKFGINPLSIAPAARARQFALAAEPAILMNPSGYGGGRSGDIGSLDNHAPILKDHGTLERTVGGVQDEKPNFVNEAEVGLLVASDRTMPKSGDNPCDDPGGGEQRPTTTPRQGGGPVISGGPADGVGGSIGG
jgi:hypothetical protein